MFRTEYRTSILGAFFEQTNPSFKIDSGIARSDFTYQNYTINNSKNYPVYNMTFVFTQQSDRTWKLTDIQGIEDLYSSNFANQKRIADAQSISKTVVQYLNTKNNTPLDNTNWRKVLNDFYQKENQTASSLPDDPIARYGNNYQFAINSNKDFVIAVNLDTVENDVFKEKNEYGFTYLQEINILSDKHTNELLGIDCTPPTACFIGLSDDWSKLLSTASTASPK